MSHSSHELAAYAKAWLDAYNKDPSTDPGMTELVSMAMGVLTYDDLEYMGNIMGVDDTATILSDNSARIAFLHSTMNIILNKYVDLD